MILFMLTLTGHRLSDNSLLKRIYLCINISGA